MGPRRDFEPAGDEQRYFGTGTYGEGGSGFGGGYGGPEETEQWQVPDESIQGGEPPLTGRETSPIYGRGPKNYQRSDERIQEDISERLLHAYHIDSSEVTVAVEAGRVTFEGTVPDRTMKHAIEDLADRCPGVQDIQNRVKVSKTDQS